MVLYQTISTYHLLCAMVHNLRNKGESILLISKWIADKYKHFSELDKFFVKVIVFDPIWEKEGNDCKPLLIENDVLLENVAEIHVMGAHYKFGAFLVENEIPFVFWEDAAGMLSQKDILSNMEKSQPAKQSYCLERGLYDGQNNCIFKRVGNLNVQKYGFENDGMMEHFDVVENLYKFEADVRNAIISFFVDLDKINVDDKNSVIFLTQHFSNLGLMTFDEQAIIYQYVIDYFFENKQLIFKTHPDDIMYYKKLFPDCKVVRHKFPSEFLPFMFEIKPHTVGTISSTAIKNVYKHFEDSFMLNVEFEKDFKKIHKYYCALKIIEKFNSVNLKKIGVNDNLVNELTNRALNIEYVSDKSVGDNVVYLIDDISTGGDVNREKIFTLMESIGEDNVIIFLNTKQDFCFYDIYHKEIWENIIPVSIKRKFLLGEDSYEIEKDVLYFYSKNKEKLRMAKEFTTEKTLKYSNEEICVDVLTEEQRKIMVLEGMLKATEERLLYYMKGENTK